MPERAEVYVAAAHAAHVAVGRRIDRLAITHPRTTRHQPADAFTPFVGQRITSITSVGKWVVLRTDDHADAIGIHLRMSGQLIAAAPGDEHPDRHVHAVVHLGRRALAPPVDPRVPVPPVGGVGTGTEPVELWFRDPRTFGEWRVLPDAAVSGAPDVLDDAVSGRDAARRVRGRHLAVKAALLDQQLVVSGIGSYLADEVLHAVGLDPRMPASRLRPTDWDHVLRTARDLANTSAALGGVSLADEGWVDLWGRLGGSADRLRVHARTHCQTCGGPTSVATVSGRSARWCRACQRRGSRSVNRR